MSGSPRRTPIVELPPEVADGDYVSVRGYQCAARRTDRLSESDLTTPILGIFGEIGGLLTVAKKKEREHAAYAAYEAAVVEELGDLLWYLSTLASHAHLEFAVIAHHVPHAKLNAWADDRPDEQLSFDAVQKLNKRPGLDAEEAMLDLASLAGELVAAHRANKLDGNRDAISGHLVSLLRAMVAVANATGTNLEDAARGNLEKTFGRWPLPGAAYVGQEPRDADLPYNERLPRQFKLLIKEHTVSGKTYVLQQCNGITIGDRLTDNKTQKDDYRFHDVFHIAFAVHLEWSPVLRALFRAKRKSLPHLDENEDGARAIIAEEGIANFVFGRGLERGMFEGLSALDYDLLKLVLEQVRGFEAERCPPWQWERAILDGFKVFRELVRPENRGGWIVADLDAHTLHFEADGNSPRL